MRPRRAPGVNKFSLIYYGLTHFRSIARRPARSARYLIAVFFIKDARDVSDLFKIRRGRRMTDIATTTPPALYSGGRSTS